jgi:2-keto-3-deoxy-L-fuconate dehydrogenase
VGEAAHVSVDLAPAGAPERAVAEAVAALGGLDVLVNNVGLARHARFEDVPDEEWDVYWQLNVMSYVRATRAALPHLGSGSAIVNVSSTAGKRPSTGMPHYSVTKAAVLSLSRLVADLYASEGIRCNAVCPGTVDTPSLQDRINAFPDPVEARKMFIARQPMGRLAKAEEIAPIVVFLASDESVFATGNAYAIDGGMTI